ncbi:hypothetical protein C8J56DRAFT_1049068 [Mycena floridula]|nr:hypothetical protein C8J56DRAFT_1049068 [Mycena floridula]
MATKKKLILSVDIPARSPEKPVKLDKDGFTTNAKKRSVIVLDEFDEDNESGDQNISEFQPKPLKKRKPATLEEDRDQDDDNFAAEKADQWISLPAFQPWAMHYIQSQALARLGSIASINSHANWRYVSVITGLNAQHIMKPPEWSLKPIKGLQRLALRDRYFNLLTKPPKLLKKRKPAALEEDRDQGSISDLELTPDVPTKRNHKAKRKKGARGNTPPSVGKNPIANGPLALNPPPPVPHRRPAPAMQDPNGPDLTSWDNSFNCGEHQMIINEWNKLNPDSTYPAARPSHSQVHYQISIPGQAIHYKWADPPVPGMTRNNAEIHVRMEALDNNQNVVWVCIPSGFTCPAINITDSNVLRALHKDHAAEEGGGSGSDFRADENEESTGTSADDDTHCQIHAKKSQKLNHKVGATGNPQQVTVEEEDGIQEPVNDLEHVDDNECVNDNTVMNSPPTQCDEEAPDIEDVEILARAFDAVNLVSEKGSRYLKMRWKASTIDLGQMFYKKQQKPVNAEQDIFGIRKTGYPLIDAREEAQAIIKSQLSDIDIAVKANIAWKTFPGELIHGQGCLNGWPKQCYSSVPALHWMGIADIDTKGWTSLLGGLKAGMTNIGDWNPAMKETDKAYGQIPIVTDPPPTYDPLVRVCDLLGLGHLKAEDNVEAEESTALPGHAYTCLPTPAAAFSNVCFLGVLALLLGTLNISCIPVTNVLTLF